MFGLDTTLTILLVICLLAACIFEFINGFHDTANAVATVIYTNSLRPWVAVIWSGIWNSIGVFAGGITVAIGITNLLPVEVLIDPNVYHSVALILALLLTAIIWNLGTWYYGIPCSSSHTLVGSILGVGLAYSFIAEKPGSYVNWAKATDIGMSLLLSPLFGFSLAVVMMYILRILVKNRAIFKSPKTTDPPPLWIRTILLLTCTGVSFSHGSNDGQKGVGLVMLILIAVVPGYYAINTLESPQSIRKNLVGIELVTNKVNHNLLSIEDSSDMAKVNKLCANIHLKIDSGVNTLNELNKDEKFAIRKNIIVIGKTIKKLTESKDFPLSTTDKSALKKATADLKGVTEYAPYWVILMISLSLGIGTMFGWKRIVKTIGEKIGKQHLTYAQGASSEMVAMGTISLATWLGLPVSTTQVLSSGVAGSMVASKGIKNLQGKTIANIALAWILTLPVTILLSGGLFLLFRAIM